MAIRKEYENRLSEKWQVLSRAYEEYAKVVGLTSMSLTVLEIIYENQDNCTQKLICEQSQFTKQSINMIVKSFWKEGYVDLVEMQSDRRNKYVKLSEKGHAFADKIVQTLWKGEDEATEKITEEQQEALYAFMNLYEKSIQKAITEIKETCQKDKVGR